MPVPSVIGDLSTTAASNSPAGSDSVFPDLDNFIRALSAFIAQLNANKAGLASPTFTGTVTADVLTTTGNTTLGNATADTLNVGNGGIVKDASGNTTLGGSLTMTNAISGVTNLTTTGNTILGNAASDTLDVGSGGLIKDASGNVGIGVTPAAKLHVKGAAELIRLENNAAFLSGYNTAGSVRTGYLQFDSTGAILLLADTGNYLAFGAGGSERMRITTTGVIQDAAALELGFKGLPTASVTTGAFAAADRGKCVYATAGVTIPNSTMAATDAVVIQNTTGSSITITKTVTTAYNTNTGSALGATFTLAARGRASIVFTSATECYVSGNIS